MNILSWIIGLLSSLASTGTFGKSLAIFVAVVGGVSGLVSGLMLLWQAVIKILQALAIIPGLSSLAALAVKLQADEQSVSSWENSFLLPILNQLSAIPVPTAAPAVVAAK